MITSKFYLANENGVRVSMNVGDPFFFCHAEGLGATTDYKYASIENGFFPRTKEDYRQEQIIGDIVFLDNAFENYAEVTDFIWGAKELYFVYCPTNAEFYRRVGLSEVKKGIRTAGGQMTATVRFKCLTPWFLPLPVELHFYDKKTEVFKWSETAWGTAPWAMSLAEGFTASVTADGHMNASVEVEYTGAATRPIITAVNSKGESLGMCKITFNLVDGDVLRLSSQYNDSYCVVERGNEVIDLMPYVDLTVNPFFRLPPGEQCTVSITSNNLPGVATVKIYSYYRSV